MLDVDERKLAKTMHSYVKMSLARCHVGSLSRKEMNVDFIGIKLKLISKDNEKFEYSSVSRKQNIIYKNVYCVFFFYKFVLF